MTPNLSHVAGLELAKKAMRQQRERYGGVHKASLACLDGLIEIAKSALAEPDAELVELLRDARELIEHGDFREGHCMCGSAVEAHGFGDGHSPVDAGVYYAGQVMESIDAKLASLKGAP